VLPHCKCYVQKYKVHTTIRVQRVVSRKLKSEVRMTTTARLTCSTCPTCDKQLPALKRHSHIHTY